MNNLIVEKASFIDGKRKYLICSNHRGMELIQPIFEKLLEKNYSFDFVFIGFDTSPNQYKTNIKTWLENQKMGSYLYIALSKEELKNVRPIIEDVGFFEDEVQYVGYGEMNSKVFCCRCHSLTELVNLQFGCEIKCQNCQLLLSVSNHYSTLYDAYLGNIAKL
ncbi:hypothetical protein [Bacillus sp. AFS017336]|uniref:hypothetical protein n=1 Tax=Bacillus sp. AFS017336 TaxID=2033489 RepID=UPI000BF0ACCD|nr:hypothetical protein [Bacillus sp. AFS017336]PEK98986.1 hypothetical protein CN601_24035 [Bacillus sp. AFS017336]